MKWYIIFAIITLFGCKDAAEIQIMKEKLLLENKKYFNSERAAKILYEESTKYFKYGTFLHAVPKSKLLYCIVLDKNKERPHLLKKTIKNKMNKGFYLSRYIDGNSWRGARGASANGTIHYFDASNKKSLFKNDILDVLDTQLYVTSCHFRYGDTRCLTREDTEDWVSYGQGFPSEFTNKAFKNYHSYYNGKKIIYDNQSRVLKKIDYKGKKIKYYFYDSSKRYEVVCNYINEECEIKHNCDYRHKEGQGCGLVES